jgi:hypothetical protein
LVKSVLLEVVVIVRGAGVETFIEVVAESVGFMVDATRLPKIVGTGRGEPAVVGITLKGSGSVEMLEDMDKGSCDEEEEDITFSLRIDGG